MTDIAQSGFDYAAIPAAHRDNVEAATRRLHTLERRTSEAIIEIGKELIAVKKDIGHGNFGPWLEAEFGWSQPTARRFMAVAETFSQNDHVDRFETTALYALASPSTPDDVRDGFAELASLGQPVTHKDVKQEIDRRKRADHIPAGTPKPDILDAETIDAETGEILDDAPPPFEEVDPAEPSAFLPPSRPISDTRRQPDPVKRPDPIPSAASVEFTEYGKDYEAMTFQSLALPLDAMFGDGFTERFGRWTRTKAA